MPAGTTPPRVGRSPEQRLLDLLGLAARARAMVHGTDGTRKAVREGEVHCVIIAGDSSLTQRQKLEPLLEARGVPGFVCLSRERIGGAIGRAEVSAVGLTDKNFARRAAELATMLVSPQE